MSRISLNILVCLGIALQIPSSPAVAQQDEITLFEMQTLANGLNVALLDIDRYVAMENLNDLSATNTTFPFDSIRQNGGVYSLIPSVGTFMPRRDFTVGTLTWNGPYVNYQQDRIQTDTTPYDQGSLLDFWGNPYYLFNPLGLLRGDQGIITQELYGDQFDRYTIVSLGPDGTMSSDDIIYEFGQGLDGSHLTSLKGPGVTLISAPQDEAAYEVVAGTSVTLRGINLNRTGDKAVFFGSINVTPVHSWGNREVVITAPETLTGTDDFTLQVGTLTIGSLRATMKASDTGVINWVDY